MDTKALGCRTVEDSAKYWAETFLAKCKEKMTAAGGFDTWTKFKTAVLKHFGDEDLSDKANCNINRLRHHGDICTYITAFKEMAENATLNDDALLQIFQRGLKGRLYD